MRFSLRFMLFVAPCIFVVVYFVSWHVQGYVDSNREDKTISPWAKTFIHIDCIDQHISENILSSNEISITDLNTWFEGHSPASLAILLKTYNYTQHQTDDWGQRLFAVGLDETELPTQDTLKVKKIGIYSKGRDEVFQFSWLRSG